MPAGEVLVGKVAGTLNADVGKRMDTIAFDLPGYSTRALRYAVKELVDAGRARRRGHLIFAATPVVAVSAEAAPELETA